MSTPDPLSAFIEARLAERQASAWLVHDVSKCDALLYEEDMAGAAARDPDCDCGMRAAVLRDVAAKRAILAGHWAHSEPERWIDGPKAGQATGRTAYWCSTCDQDRDYGYISGPQEGCATLRHLAAIDAGHPDYDPSWAPGSS